jgi:hypothetical protein
MTDIAENLNPVEGDPDLADDPLSSLEGQLLARRDRRRMDLMSFDGLLREHGRIYRQFKAGRVGLKRFDAASRALRRQGELLRDRDARLLVEREVLASALAAEPQLGAEPPSMMDMWRTLSFVSAAPAVELPPAESTQ